MKIDGDSQEPRKKKFSPSLESRKTGKTRKFKQESRKVGWTQTVEGRFLVRPRRAPSETQGRKRADRGGYQSMFIGCCETIIRVCTGGSVLQTQGSERRAKSLAGRVGLPATRRDRRWGHLTQVSFFKVFNEGSGIVLGRLQVYTDYITKLLDLYTNVYTCCGRKGNVARSKGVWCG